MKSEYRYLGTETEIGRSIRLDQLGQKVLLEGDEALNAMRGGCLIIPSAEYDKLGFTADEEKAFKWPGARQQAPQEFKTKLFKGWALWRKILDEDAMGISATAIPPMVAPSAPKPVAIPEPPKAFPVEPPKVEEKN